MRRLFIIISAFVFVKNGYSQADSLPPGSVGYRITKAIEKAREKKYDEAIRMVDSLLPIAKAKDDMYGLKAEFLWLKKDYHNAALAYEQAIVIDRDSSHLKGAYLFLGVLYEKAGNRDEAQKQYLTAIYLLETNKRKNDRFFEPSNIVDYAVALKLSGLDKKWEGFMSDPRFDKYHGMFKGRSRTEVLKKYWGQYDGG